MGWRIYFRAPNSTRLTHVSLVSVGFTLSDLFIIISEGGGGGGVAAGIVKKKIEPINLVRKIIKHKLSEKKIVPSSC